MAEEARIIDRDTETETLRLPARALNVWASLHYVVFEAGCARHDDRSHIRSPFYWRPPAAIEEG
jgi:hypothetical protein